MNYVVDHYSMSARRHAIRPDEAEYLTRNLPRLDTSSCCESPHQLRGQEEIRDTASSTTFNASSAPEEYHFRSSSWETNRSSALSDQDNVAPTAHLHDGQRQWPNPDGMTWEKLATFSGDLLPKHLDNKRKFVAMSGAEDVIDPSPPAMDIVHPSEIGRKQGKHREQGHSEVQYSVCFGIARLMKPQRNGSRHRQIPRSTGSNATAPISPRDTSFRSLW